MHFLTTMWRNNPYICKIDILKEVEYQLVYNGSRGDNMKINYRHKKVLLERLYEKLEIINEKKLSLEISLEIKQSINSISFCDTGYREELVVILNSSHSMSEVSIIRNGVKYFYPKRELRLKKNNLEDLLNTFRRDERLNGCYNTLESYLAVIMNTKTDPKTKKISRFYVG